MKLFKSIRVISLVLVCCLLLVSLPGTCSAQYQVSETELTRLEIIFQQLEINNQKLLIELAQSKGELTTLEIQLVALKKESAQAKVELQTAQNSLQKANQSLTAYEKETNSKIRALKLQRDLGYLAFVAMLFKK